MNMFPVLSRASNAALLSVFLVGLVLFGMISYWQRSEDRKCTAEKAIATSDKSLLAEGVAVEECIAGQKRASVQIGTIRLAGKKKGFLRLGFFKVISCEGMIIDIYPPVTERILRGEIFPLALAGENGTPVTFLSPAEHQRQTEVTERRARVTQIQRSTPADHDLQDLLCRKLALSFGISPLTVKGLELKNNILLRLHDHDRIILSLQSMHADFDPRRKSIVFEDAVHVASHDGKTLETGRLEWLLKKGVLQTRHSYTFINDGRQQQGTSFVTDLHLRPLDPAATANMKRKET
jgi:hypothetical protein